MPYGMGPAQDHSSEPSDLQGCAGIVFGLVFMAVAMAIFLYFVL